MTIVSQETEMINENSESRVVICKGVVSDGNRITIDLENHSLSELITEIVSRFLSLDLSGEVTKSAHDEAHLLSAACQFLQEQQSEEGVEDWVNSVIYFETETLQTAALVDAVAKKYPELPSFALSHIKIVAEMGLAAFEARLDTNQLVSLISFHLRSVLLPLWRNEEFSAQLNMLQKLKKPIPTLEELTEQVNSLRLEIEKIQHALYSASRSLAEQRFDNKAYRSGDGLPF
jgi:hypothetical protein